MREQGCEAVDDGCGCCGDVMGESRDAELSMMGADAAEM